MKQLLYSRIILVATLAVFSLKTAKATLDELPNEVLHHILVQLPNRDAIMKKNGGFMRGRSPQCQAALALRLVNRHFATFMSDELSPLSIGMAENKPQSITKGKNKSSSQTKEKNVWENPSPHFPVCVSFRFDPKAADLERLAQIKPQLKTLRFSGSKLSSWSKDEYNVLSTLTSLVTLEIYGASSLKKANFLSSLPNLQKLQILGSYIPLEEISSITHLTNLNELWIRGSSLNNFSDLSTLTSLRFLDLSNNRLNTAANFIKLHFLTYLNMSCNHALQHIEPISTLTSLEVLDLGSTGVEDISPLTFLTSLKRLDLSSTKVAILAPLTRLQNLKALELRRIRTLKSLDPLRMLTSLETLNLDLTRILSFLFLRDMISLQEITLAEEFDGPYEELHNIEKEKPLLSIRISKHDDDERY